MAAAAAPAPELYPTAADLQYEEEILREPFKLRGWWRYLVALADAPFRRRAVLYERALKALPGSYKLWHAYLRERLDAVRGLPVTHPSYAALNATFERALATMHKMPLIWVLYLNSLTQQRLVTSARRTFDRALRALPVTQHDRIWPLYLAFVRIEGVPVETAFRVFRRYLLYDPGHAEDFIEFLLSAERWQEAAERLAMALNDEGFVSVKGRSKHELWLQLLNLLTTHADEVSGLKADAIIRGGIRQFKSEVGRLWTALADYYVRRGHYEKARDVFEEGVTTVTTVRDFGVIFEAYAQFEQSTLSAKLEAEAEEGDESDEEDGRGRKKKGEDKVERLAKQFLKGCWLMDTDDTDLRLARLEWLLNRRPELLNSVLLRQNPHNVEQWHRRVKLFEGNPEKQADVYATAVATVNPMEAVGKPHTLWVSLAKLYESHKDIKSARVVFQRAAQVNFKAVDHLASIWCEWAEMELRHQNFDEALELMRQATAEPSVEVKRRAAAGGNEHVQMKLHKSLRLWSLYVDLEESLGTLESTRSVYERILDLRIATPQIILNYAYLLEENKFFEDAFKVYERGAKIFKYPHVRDIWTTYLQKFIKRYGKSKLERARELYEQAIQAAPASEVKPLYIDYAKFEEEYGLSRRAMDVYSRAVKAVPNDQKLSMYEIYIARAAEHFGVPRTREIYEQAIESVLPDKDVLSMCLKYAELEKSLGEIDRARAVYVFASNHADPKAQPDFWIMWNRFEIAHGNEDTFREMLRIKRTVTASRSQSHFILPEYLMQKDRKFYLEEAVDTLKRAGVQEDEMAALERQLAPAPVDTPAKDGRKTMAFVSAGVETAANRLATNSEEIELPEEDNSDDDKIELAQKDVPAAVFGSLAEKAADLSGRSNAAAVVDDPEGSSNRIGALERLRKRQKQT